MASAEDVREFFAWSEGLDYWVLRPLSHITLNWEVSWDHGNGRYAAETDSFAEELNVVIDLIAACPAPVRYHDNEDQLAQWVLRDLGWPIQKKGSRWIGADYASILEQGGFADLDQQELTSASSGRVRAAITHGQSHVDQMEDGHRTVLTALITIIIYHRLCDGTSTYVAC